jgi:hypothetical protein
MNLGTLHIFVQANIKWLANCQLKNAKLDLYLMRFMRIAFRMRSKPDCTKLQPYINEDVVVDDD